MGSVYSNLKVFHFHGKLDALSRGEVTPPIHIRLKPTNRCNQRCIYCCFRNQDLFLSELLKESDEIPREKMSEIVADLIRMGVKAVTFSGGGEPLVYPHIIETIEGLRAGGIKVAMLTHASLLSGRAAALLAREASWVRVSMDAADAESYAQIRQVSRKEFDRVCANIVAFARSKHSSCQLGVNFVVGRENYGDVFSFLSLMKSLGVDHVKVHERVVSVRKEENKEYHEPLFPTVKEQLGRAKAELIGDGFGIIDNFSDLWEDEHGKDYRACPFIQCLTIIAADLNVYTCQDKAYTSSGKLGSLREQSFGKMWSSAQTAARLKEIDPSVDCGHHCVQHVKNLMLLEYINVDRDHLDFV